MRNRDRGSDRDRRYGGSDRGGYRGGRSRSRSRSRTRSRTRSPPPPSRYESSRSHHRSERRRTRSRSNGPNGHHHHMADRPAPVSNGDRGTHYRSKSHSISPRPLRKRSRSGSLRYYYSQLTFFLSNQIISDRTRSTRAVVELEVLASKTMTQTDSRNKWTRHALHLLHNKIS